MSNNGKENCENDNTTDVKSTKELAEENSSRCRARHEKEEVKHATFETPVSEKPRVLRKKITYYTSPRIFELAQPKTIKVDKESADQASSSKPRMRDVTSHILRLALPYRIREKMSPQEKGSRVPETALLYTATERIKELSVPKKILSNNYSQTYEKENPFSVAPAALTYTPTKRIIQLAQTKRS